MGLTYQQKAQLAAWELVRKDKDITQLDLLKCGPHIDAIYHVIIVTFADHKKRYLKI